MHVSALRCNPQLSGRREDERRIVNHISKTLKEMKQSFSSFLHLPLFPSCVYQSFSNILSMSSGSLCSGPRAQLMASFRSFSLSCECTLFNFIIFPAAFILKVVFGTQRVGISFVSDEKQPAIVRT